MAQTPAGTPEYTEQHLNAFLDRLLTTADQTVYKHIDLALHHDAQYDQTELLNLLAHCAISGEFDNGGAKTRRHDADGTVVRSDTRCPISRALGRHLRQLDFGSITSQFDAIFEELHSLTRTARRWGIETSYRVIGEFLPRSRSTYFEIRLFYFLFAVTLYNLWVLVNGLLSVAFDVSTDHPVLTAGVFGRSLRNRWIPIGPTPAEIPPTNLRFAAGE